MLMPTLISRFREREENVKMDVFATFNDLLHQVSSQRNPGPWCMAAPVDPVVTGED